MRAQKIMVRKINHDKPFKHFYATFSKLFFLEIPICSGDGALMCEYQTQFGDRKWVIFGVLVYHVYSDCAHSDAYYVFNRISTQFSFICCTQGPSRKIFRFYMYDFLIRHRSRRREITTRTKI